ncbi:glycosyltransferase family 4 protein [Saliphagus sp. GCM10025308]
MAENPSQILCLFHRGFELFPRGYKQIESLSSAGHDVTVLCAARSDLPETETYEGAEIRRFRTPWPNFAPIKPFVILWILLVLIAKGLSEDEVDSIHCFGIYSLLSGVVLSSLKETSLTYDAFEDYRYQFERSGAVPVGTKFFGRQLVRFERWLASLSDGVFVVPSADNVLEQRFADVDTRVATIWNVPRLREGINRSNLKPKGNERVTVLYVGGISVHKGACEMVEAAVQTLEKVDKPTKFVFIGGHSHETARKLNRLIPAALEEDIEFPGFIPYDEVEPYLHVSDIALQLYQPTFWNRQSKASSKLFRYMAAQIPVVISDFPGIGHLIRDTEAGLAVDPTDPDDAASALIELVEQDEKRQQLGQNGYSAFKERYNWKFEERRFLEAFEATMVSTST